MQITGFLQRKMINDASVRIAMDNGQNWRDLVKWNNLENPNVIEVGQVLRVVPPVSEGTPARPAAPIPPRPAGAASAPG